MDSLSSKKMSNCKPLDGGGLGGGELLRNNKYLYTLRYVKRMFLDTEKH